MFHDIRAFVAFNAIGLAVIGLLFWWGVSL